MRPAEGALKADLEGRRQEVLEEPELDGRLSVL